MKSTLRKRKVITINFPPKVLRLLEEAAEVSGMSLSDVVNVILAFAVVRHQQTQPPGLAKPARKRK